VVSPFNIRKAAHSILQGGIIAYPTEAVYGVGCDPYQSASVFRLLELKNRPVEKGLILVGSSLDQFDDFIEPLTSKQKTLIKDNPTTTWLVPAKHAPDWLKGKHNTLAIRLSAHPLIVALCNETGQALVSTSANPAGKNPAKNNLQARQYFRQLDIILNSETGTLNRPTEIRNLIDQSIIRSN